MELKRFLIILLSIYFLNGVLGDDIMTQTHVSHQLSKPASYVVETSYPKSNVLEANTTYSVLIWPKNENGENTTLTGSHLELIPKPYEYLEMKRINKQNINVMELEFHVTEPLNPMMIYIIDGNELITEPLKFAIIERGKINSDKSSVSVSGPGKVGEITTIVLSFKDAYGKPTTEGSNLVKFRSVSEEALEELNLVRVSHPNPTPGEFHFSVNCSKVGEFPLNVTYRNNHLSGSPITLSFVPGNMSHEKSRILGYGSWIAELRQPNTIYVQVLDGSGNEIIDVPTPASKEYDGNQESDIVDEDVDSSIIEKLSEKITVKGWNGRRQELDTLQYFVEYIGKSTWGIRYTIEQDNTDVILLGLFYEDIIQPIGRELLTVYAQTSGFPYPPNSYKMIGPYPARPEIVEPSSSSISTLEHKLKSYSLDKHGWLPVDYLKVPMTDTDYKADLVGTFHVEEAGVYSMICLGAEHYNIDIPILYSGDVWNIHELSEGTHTLQVSVLSKRNWNFDFQCRFQVYTPLKSYPSESGIPDIINGNLMGDLNVVLQNLYVKPIDDLQVKVLAINDTNVKPVASFTNTVVLDPQELTQVQIQLSFTTEENYDIPKDDFFVIIGFYSPSTKGETQITVRFRVRNIGDSIRFTYEDVDETGQVAIAIPPSQECLNCPVMLVSHGGGVDVLKLAELFPPQPNGWWIFPKGRCVIPHELGPLFESNSLMAIDGLKKLTKSNEIFSFTSIDVDSILSIGSHYQGGKAALLIAERNPDRMLGVSADSGWIKHSEPRIDDFLHPMISGLVRWSSVPNEFSFTTSNLRYVPFFVGSGYGDSVGYPWRLFYQQTLLDNEKIEVKADNAVGLSYKKHPTAVIRPSDNVVSFVETRLAKAKMLPREFTVTSTHPSLFKGRGGVHITSFNSQIQIASIDVQISGDLWKLNTTNVHSFELLKLNGIQRASQILIDGTHSFIIDSQGPARFFMNENNQWKEQLKDNRRNLNQYGPVSSLYNDKVTIVCGTLASAPIIQVYQQYSIYIANELFKQNRIDARIVPDVEYLELDSSEHTNIILIGGPQSNVVTKNILETENHPISFNDGELIIGNCHLSCEKEAGALFLTPHGEKLGLVVTASSIGVFESIVHSLPLHTPYDAFPDYVIYESDHIWKGGNGIVSTGYFDYNWNLNPSTNFQNCPTYFPHPENQCYSLW